jgi:hypothetical protein
MPTPSYLQAAKLVFSFIVCVLARYIHIIGADQKLKLKCPFWLPQAFQTADSNSEQQYRLDISLFQNYFAGNASRKRSPIPTLLQVSFKHNVINLTNVIDIPNAMKTLILQQFPPNRITCSL